MTQQDLEKQFMGFKWQLKIPSNIDSEIAAGRMWEPVVTKWIQRNLKDGDIVIAMDARGKQLSSEKFAELLRNEGSSGQRLRFVIGGTAGLQDELLKRATKQISLSDMTFPHELARVMLLEQLYRAVTIINNKKYHY